MQTTNPELTAAALDNLLRFLLTGCGHASRRAAILLERLAAEPGTDTRLQIACQRLSERLALEAARASAALPVKPLQGSDPREGSHV